MTKPETCEHEKKTIEKITMKWMSFCGTGQPKDERAWWRDAVEGSARDGIRIGRSETIFTKEHYAELRDFELKVREETVKALLDDLQYCFVVSWKEEYSENIKNWIAQKRKEMNL